MRGVRDQVISLGLRDELSPFCLVEVELRPLRLSQFTGPHEQHRCRLERTEHEERVDKAVERAKHLANFAGSVIEVR